LGCGCRRLSRYDDSASSLQSLAGGVGEGEAGDGDLDLDLEESAPECGGLDADPGTLLTDKSSGSVCSGAMSDEPSQSMSRCLKVAAAARSGVTVTPGLTEAAVMAADADVLPGHLWCSR